MRNRRKTESNDYRILKIILECKHCPFFGEKTEKESCIMGSLSRSDVPDVCPLPKTISMKGRIIVAKDRKEDVVLF